MTCLFIILGLTFWFDRFLQVFVVIVFTPLWFRSMENVENILLELEEKQEEERKQEMKELLKVGVEGVKGVEGVAWGGTKTGDEGSTKGMSWRS